MKKKMRVLVMVITVMLVLLIGTVPVLAEVSLPYGDVDGSGKINAGDALLILRHSVGKAPMTEAQRTAADVSGEGEINARDALLVLKYAVDIINRFPVEVNSEPEGIAINEENFPDGNFRSIVRQMEREYLDCITLEELSRITVLDLSGFEEIDGITYPREAITDLTGIEYFTQLEELDCSSNALTTLDLSEHIALKKLNCSYNQLQTLKLPQNTVVELNCGNNQLEQLDVSSYDELIDLNCEKNRLTALNISKNAALTNLNCAFNQIAQLDVSANTALTELYCDGNPIAALDVTKNTALVLLGIEETQIPQLTLENNQALQYVWHDEADLGTWQPAVVIDQTNFPDPVFREDVKGVDTDKNGILSAEEIELVTEFEFRTMDFLNEVQIRDFIFDAKGIEFFVALERLSFSQNRLSEIDVSRNTALLDLFLRENNISRLDISRNTKLTNLVVWRNYNLSELDVSNNTVLESINCRETLIFVLDITANTRLHTIQGDEGLVIIKDSKSS